ncbi:MAG: hypothetical protein ABIO70_05965 [Pseudomonadota bacterium]
MDPLTFDLIVTILASLAVLAAGGLAVWVLPWSEEAWAPCERPEPRRGLPVRLNELADITTH